MTTTEIQPQVPNLQDNYTTIATLSTGEIVYGTFDSDGSPLNAYYEAKDGYFFVDGSGHMSGSWGGKDLGIRPEQLYPLQELFTSNKLSQLQDIARLWDGEAAPALDCTSGYLIATAGIFKAVERWAGRLGLLRKLVYPLHREIAVLMDNSLGIVDFEEAPALERVIAQRKERKGSTAPPAPSAAP